MPELCIVIKLVFIAFFFLYQNRWLCGFFWLSLHIEPVFYQDIPIKITKITKGQNYQKAKLPKGKTTKRQNYQKAKLAKGKISKGQN